MVFNMNNSKSQQFGKAYIYIAFAIAAFSVGTIFYLLLNQVNNSSGLDHLTKATPLHDSNRSFPTFSLVDQNGKTFTNYDLKDSWSFIFFGFTHCPDVCPLTLNTLDNVISSITPNETVNVQAVLISVDTERDSPKKLKSYVEHFNNKTIGLTGEETQLRHLTKSLGVVYTSEKSANDNNYLIDHSAHIFLVAPNGNLIALFSTPHEYQTIASDFDILSKHYKTSQGS